MLLFALRFSLATVLARRTCDELDWEYCNMCWGWHSCEFDLKEKTAVVWTTASAKTPGS